MDPTVDIAIEYHFATVELLLLLSAPAGGLKPATFMKVIYITVHFM